MTQTCVECDEYVAIISYINLTGNLILPFVVFKGKASNNFLRISRGTRKISMFIFDLFSSVYGQKQDLLLLTVHLLLLLCCLSVRIL